MRKGVSLDRALSKLGLASRSQARELILSGNVEVDGRVARDPSLRVIPERIKVRIAGADQRPSPWTFIALHKPRGVITSRHDPEGRPTVYDLITDIGVRVVPVGRLDFATSGLLLMTNDTQLANWLTDPANAVVRRYVVTVRGELTDVTARALERGVTDRGEVLNAKHVAVLKRSKRETHMTIEMVEGKNREIRRMLDAVGHEVTRLKRIGYGGLELGTLAAGKWRAITREEVARAFGTVTLQTSGFGLRA
jgi:23S rRNA pseudouridine2605 synthase